MKNWIILFVGMFMVGCRPFQAESDALLAETGVKCQVLSRKGGLRDRKMYCDLALAQADVEKLARALDLTKPVSTASPATRVVHLSDGESFDSPSLVNRINDAFGKQLWAPAKHGFAGAFLIYDAKKGVGRLWLSIAYG